MVSELTEASGETIFELDYSLPAIDENSSKLIKMKASEPNLTKSNTVKLRKRSPSKGKRRRLGKKSRRHRRRRRRKSIKS